MVHNPGVPEVDSLLSPFGFSLGAVDDRIMIYPGRKPIFIGRRLVLISSTSPGPDIVGMLFNPMLPEISVAQLSHLFSVDSLAFHLRLIRLSCDHLGVRGLL